MTTRSLETLLRGAVSLVMASSAVVSGCGQVEGSQEPGIEGDDGFISVSCDDPLGDLLRGLSPAPTVDYLELRAFGSHSSGSALASVGQPCATAQDPMACLAEVATSTTSRSFRLGPCGQVCGEYYLVVTRGDEVAVLDTSSDVAGLLGPIDTPQEASLLVEMQGFHVRCGRGGAKPEGDAFLVQAFTYAGCDGETRHLFDVSAASAVALRQSVVLQEPNPQCTVGRRPAGLVRTSRRGELPPIARYLVDAARLEAASVHAFRHVASELALHGAPRRLIDAARRAAADEVRHTRVTAGLARRFGARRLERPRVVASPPRDLEAMLLDNAVEGCVRETFGAAVGVWQSQYAAEVAVAEAMRHIAADELRHAALAWQLAAWGEPKLGATALRRVREARRAAASDLRAELEQPPHASVTTALGVPSVDSALRLHRELERRIWG